MPDKNLLNKIKGIKEKELYDGHNINSNHGY